MLQVYPTTTPAGALAAQELVDVEHQISLLQLRAAQLAAEVAQTDFADRHGFNSTGDWMRFNCHLIDRTAWDRIAVGRTLAGMPESHQAMQAGDIGYAHLATMARTCEAVGEAFDEKKLLNYARENTPGRFFRKCEHYRHAVDAKRYAAEQAEQTEQRKLNFSTAEGDWMWINCVLDPVGGAAVRNAIEALARPSGAHDYREKEQRLADALVELATTGGNQRVQM